MHSDYSLETAGPFPWFFSGEKAPENLPPGFAPRRYSPAGLQEALDGMILSASGWRGLFGVPGSQGQFRLSAEQELIVLAAARAFGERCLEYCPAPRILVGMDTRPSGPAIHRLTLAALLGAGCGVQTVLVAAAPELFAFARSGFDGFLYISASHNPIGYNGLKFGGTGCGVLNAAEAEDLIRRFRAILAHPGFVTETNETLSRIPRAALAEAYSQAPVHKAAALEAYMAFARETGGIGNREWGMGNGEREGNREQGTGNRGFEAAVSEATGQSPDSTSDSLTEKSTPDSAETAFLKLPTPDSRFRRNCVSETPYSRLPIPDSRLPTPETEPPLPTPHSPLPNKPPLPSPLAIAADFNGSARTVSIDREFFAALGIEFAAINDRPGDIAHAIIPEGESLLPAAEFLEKKRRENPGFTIAYTPDCDGDRGNLVLWDGEAPRILEAQEVFALACTAELSWLVYAGLLEPGRTKAAIAANGPTSLRIDRIAECFGVRVFRAETGEANVVNLGKRLRNEGWQVRILGEGAAGGYITHPAAWRDPLNTLMSLVKFFALRGEAGRPGPFQIWCGLSGQDYREDFTFSDILSSLPAFTTTPTSAPEAMLKIVTEDQGLLKARYQKIFLRDWEEKKATLRERGITGWEACAYNGENSTENIKDFAREFIPADSGRGGFKIIFTNEKDSKIASLWMRGSGTEPVFRIIADLEGTDRTFAETMIQWQRRMVLEADGQGSGINAKR